MRYRPDIDGLRALAVVPVVLFHMGLPVFSGGYVGVDIFFVISGYLITGIIYGEIVEGRFSIVRFYERRIRRIFPALIVVLTSVAVMACLVDLPSELRNLPRNLAGAVLFSSNIMIWRHSGYFDAPAETNPLLHTWSLGVEEQFYIAVPIFLFLLTRYLPRHVKPVLMLAATASLALSIWLTPLKPDASFFLMPTRAWELLAGSLIAIGCVPLPRGRLTREILAWAGLAMIGASILLFSPETTFPGYAAMLPVFGAAFLISAAEGTTAARLLGSLPAVAVGRISYSLYLWHWPIIVFGRRLDLIGSGWESILVACILSGLVAALSWKYVEQPFRGKAIGASKVFYFAGASAVAIFVASIALKASDGWPSRLPARVVAFDAASHDISPMRSACHTDHGLPDVGSSCIFGGKDASIAVWSDSHGVELSYALGTQYRPVMSITYSSCPPALGYNAVTRPDCPAHNRQVFQFLASSRSIDTVVLTAYYLGVGGPEFDADFSRTIRRLRASGKRVIVIGPFPSSGDDVPKALAHGRSRFFPKRSYEERYSKPISFLSTLQKDGVTVIWPDQFFCKGSECILSENGHPLFFDRHHPSMTGARFFVQQILEKRNDHILLSASGTP